jgi:hypothetical protein
MNYRKLLFLVLSFSIAACTTGPTRQKAIIRAEDGVVDKKDANRVFPEKMIQKVFQHNKKRDLSNQEIFNYLSDLLERDAELQDFIEAYEKNKLVSFGKVQIDPKNYQILQTNWSPNKNAARQVKTLLVFYPVTKTATSATLSLGPAVELRVERVEHDTKDVATSTVTVISFVSTDIPHP